MAATASPRPAAAHRPKPPAPIDQQAAALDAQHAALDLVGAAGRRAGGGRAAGGGVSPGDEPRRGE